MELTKELEEAIVAPGPQGFHPPSAAELGVLTPDPGRGLKFGHVVGEELAMEAMARTMLTSEECHYFPWSIGIVGIGMIMLQIRPRLY